MKENVSSTDLHKLMDGLFEHSTEVWHFFWGASSDCDDLFPDADQAESIDSHNLNVQLALMGGYHPIMVIIYHQPFTRDVACDQIDEYLEGLKVDITYKVFFLDSENARLLISKLALQAGKKGEAQYGSDGTNKIVRMGGKEGDQMFDLWVSSTPLPNTMSRV